jgi:hypothetical protein
MAHYVPTDGFENFTGALSKKKIQGVHHMTVTRRKKVKDPLTGEVVGFGPKEIFSQNHRDYKENPLTQGETVQRSRWREACREAPLICRDKNHPRFMEMYKRWRAQLSSNEPCQQFPNFVRTVLANEKSPN